MNIFEQLLKPFFINTRPQENIDFEVEPSIHNPENTDIRPVMFINASNPAKTSISANSKIKNPETISAPAPAPELKQVETKIRKNSTSSTTSSNRKWLFRRKSKKIIPEEIYFTPFSSKIQKFDQEFSKIKEESILSRQNSTTLPIINPFQILFHTLYNDLEENLDDYKFYCTNVSDNLKPYIKKHNNLADDIKYVNSYSNIIGNNKFGSISCPNIVSMSWQPPKNYGLQNSKQIIPHYYFETHQNVQKICGDKRSPLLEIDYLFIIKDDIRNMRKLNQYQIDYIKTLDEETKYDIICEFRKSSNMMIETIEMMRSCEPSRKNSNNDLLNHAKQTLESETHIKIRKHMPRTTSI